MVGCWRCTYPSIHLSPDEDTLMITVGCLVCGVVWWWCVCVVCGEAWRTLSLSLLLSLSFLFAFPFFFSLIFLFLSSFFFFFFSCSFSYCSCSCSFSFSSFFRLPFYSLFSSLLFSSLHANKHCTKHTASNFEAFECDVAHGTFIATANELHGMFQPLLLPPLLLSLLPSLPLLLKKKREGLFITGIQGVSVVRTFSNA